jgi:hypothetical protein
MKQLKYLSLPKLVRQKHCNEIEQPLPLKKMARRKSDCWNGGMPPVECRQVALSPILPKWRIIMAHKVTKIIVNSTNSQIKHQLTLVTNYRKK